MDIEALVRWAMDGARTVDERYTTELIVERGMAWWNPRHGISRSESIEDSIERKRQRAFNPAYEPRYSEQNLRRAAEMFAQIKQFDEFCGHDARPIRDLQVLRFLPELEQVHLHMTEVADVSPLAELPRLRSLHFSSHTCRDLRPIARCTGLRDLQLKLLKHWPDVRGLAELPEVDTLLLEGNLLVFERAVWSTVKYAVLRCSPLEARNVRDLPQLPQCEFLSLAGIETLEGIENFSKLRNLTLETPAESFEPLTRLSHLTCFTAKDHEPLDVTPLTRVPQLQFLCFNTWNKLRVRPVKPRDLSPLTDAPALRELEVIGNPLLETEAAALRAGLPSWDDLYLLPEPRPLPRLRLLAWPMKKIPSLHEENRMPGETGLIDLGLRLRELHWVGRLVNRAIDRKLGTSDWREEEKDYSFSQDFHPHIVSPTHRSVSIQFHSYGLIDKIPLVVEAMRSCLARLRPEYRLQLWIQLKAPRRKPTTAEVELLEKFRREQDDAEWERARKEREEYLERLYRLELKKQAGDKVKPEDFAPGERQPLPPAPWEKDDDEDEKDEDEGEGDVAVKKKPDPPPSWFDDDDHPLAQNYNLMATLTLGECYVGTRDRGIAEYLIHQACDEVIEEEKK